MRPQDALVPLNVFIEEFSFSIELIYAQPRNPNNHFADLYDSSAETLWLHRRIAAPALTAAVLARKWGWRLEFLDGLRPVEAQAKMADYGYDSRLVSAPGQGPHPRAMAIDVRVRDESGALVEMGTPFDHFVDEADLEAGRNPAARDFAGGWTGDELADAEIFLNRGRLEYLFLRAGHLHGERILPLAEEWWDFRLPTDAWQDLPAFDEGRLYPYQRLTAGRSATWSEVQQDMSDTVRDGIAATRTAVHAALAQTQVAPP